MLGTNALSRLKRARGQSKSRLEDFQSSLKRFRTDHLDIIQLHGIDDEKTLAKAMATDGSLRDVQRSPKRGFS